MPRATITFPNPHHEKLLQRARDNKESFSKTVVKMTEIGMMVTENEHQKLGCNKELSEIEKYCFKLIIQMNSLIKNLASEALGYGQEEFKKLLDLSDNKYKELIDKIS